MSVSYDPAPKEADDMRDALVAELPELDELRECEAKVELSFATAAEKKDGTVPPAIKWHGRPCYGLAKIINLQDRAHGGADGRVTLDARWWKTAPDNERKSVLFHELLHFELVRTEDGSIKTDDAHRPCFKMRQHDWEIGWFVAPARRFGKAAIECVQFKRIVEDSGQFLMPALFAPKDGEIRHGGDTLTIEQEGKEPIVIPAEDLARVHADAGRQLAAASA